MLRLLLRLLRLLRLRLRLLLCLLLSLLLLRCLLLLLAASAASCLRARSMRCYRPRDAG